MRYPHSEIYSLGLHSSESSQINEVRRRACNRNYCHHFFFFFFCTIVGITIRPMRCSPAGSLCIGYIHKQLELRSNMEHVVRRVYLYVSER